MAKVRFLQSTVLFSTGKTYGFNDEEELSDEKLIEHLVKNEIVDVLEEVKTQKNPPQKAKNEVKKDVK